MKKRLQGFILGILVCSLFIGIPVFATGITKSIKVVFNAVTVSIDGKQVNSDKITYNKKTYIETKSIATLLDKKYNIDKEGNILIGDSELVLKESLETMLKEIFKKYNSTKENVDQALDKWIKTKSECTSYDYDITKTNSITSPYTATASYEMIYYLTEFHNSKADALADSNYTKKRSDTINLYYSYKNGKWIYQ